MNTRPMICSSNLNIFLVCTDQGHLLSCMHPFVIVQTKQINFRKSIPSLPLRIFSLSHCIGGFVPCPSSSNFGAPQTKRHMACLQCEVNFFLLCSVSKKNWKGVSRVHKVYGGIRNCATETVRKHFTRVSKVPLFVKMISGLNKRVPSYDLPQLFITVGLQ